MSQALFAPIPGVGDTGFGNSRLFSELGHFDGLFFVGVEGISSSPSLTAARASNGNWSLTAAASTTTYFRTTLSKLIRTGEAFQYGEFGTAGIGYSAPPYPAKGIGVIDMFAVMQIIGAGLTSATLRLGTTVYSATVAQVQTDIVAATALGSLIVSNPANPLMQKVTVPVGSQQYTVADLALLEIELALVAPAGCTVTLAGLGAHLAFNLT